MTNAPDRRAELEARNAVMRETMNSLMDGISKHTEQLKQAQEHVGSTIGKASSEDGLVTVQVNGAGIVTDLVLGSSAFQYTTPKKLSQMIVRTIQDAARDAQSQGSAVFAPIQAEIPDLPDIFPGAPSVKDMIPQPQPVPDVDDEDDDSDGDEDDSRPW